MPNFRSIFRALVPSWLSEGDGGKVLDSLSAVNDAFFERAHTGQAASYPTHAGDSGLKLLADERGIPRGRSETAEHYAQRLIRWRWPRGHRTRGSAFALLEQIWEYWGKIRCWTIDVNQSRHLRDFAGVEFYEYGYPWDWDGNPTLRRARFWFVLEPNPDRPEFQPVIGVAGEYGETLEHDHTSEFSAGLKAMTPQDWDAMRRLFAGKRIWKPAGSNQQFAIVFYGDYTSSSMPSAPGNWDSLPERIAAELAYPIRFVRLRRP